MRDAKKPCQAPARLAWPGRARLAPLDANSDRVAALNSALRRVHRSVLATLAFCALIVWTTGDPDPSKAVDPRFSWVAFGLAAASILVRRALPPEPLGRRHLKQLLASLLFAGCVGGVGVVLAATGGPRGIALLYVLGAAILVLRPPPSIAVGT